MSADTPEDPLGLTEEVVRARINRHTVAVGNAIAGALAGDEVKVWACIILTEEGIASVSGGESQGFREGAKLLAAQMIDQIGGGIAAMRLANAEPAGEA